MPTPGIIFNNPEATERPACCVNATPAIDFAAASDKEISNKSPIFIIIPICATVIGIASDIGIGISPATADAPVAE